MTHWRKKYGEKVEMAHVQERPHVQLANCPQVTPT